MLAVPVPRSTPLLVLLVWLLPQAGWARAILGPHLQDIWVHLASEDRLAVWIDLAERNDRGSAKAVAAGSLVTERSLRRRAKVRPADGLTDEHDLPLESAAVQQITARVLRVRHASKWLNSLSAVATRAQIETLRGLPCARRIELVAGAPVPADAPRRRAPVARRHAVPPAAAARLQPAAGSMPVAPGLDYGPSRWPLEMLQVIALHQSGLDGSGVLVAHFDDGYGLLAHEAFLRLRIAGAWDFVDGDPDPAPPPGDPYNTGGHGVITLSLLGGYAPGQIIGAAYRAGFLLARTELDAEELPSEEDHWIAALEWADSLGADVISSSLKFFDYDPPYTSYTWRDMDGHTARVTRAADLALARGILVVNGAGNAGWNDAHNTLAAPADGDSVLAVGAVTMSGARASFSSIGPTVDGRIKPDLMAPGDLVHCAEMSNPSAYVDEQGTSLSTPLVAGVAALLFQAYPGTTPLQVRTALRQTASQAGAPGNSMGWGIVNALAAHAYLANPPTGSVDAVPRLRLEPAFPNPFNPSTRIRYRLPESAWVSLRIYDPRGRWVRDLVQARQDAREHTLLWDGRDQVGRELESGIYLVELKARAGVAVPRTRIATRKLCLVR